MRSSAAARVSGTKRLWRTPAQLAAFVSVAAEEAKVGAPILGQNLIEMELLAACINNSRNVVMELQAHMHGLQPDFKP